MARRFLKPYRAPRRPAVKKRAVDGDFEEVEPPPPPPAEDVDVLADDDEGLITDDDLSVYVAVEE